MMNGVRGWGLLATGALHLAALAFFGIFMPPAAHEASPRVTTEISARILPTPPAEAAAPQATARAAPSMALPRPLLVAAPELVLEAPAAAAVIASSTSSVAVTLATAAAPRPASAVVAEAAFEPARPPDRQCAETGIARHYPRLLRERGVEGRVLLRVKVDEQGRAAEVQVQGSGSGWRLLDEAAKALTQDCRFVPARRGEQAQASWVEYPVRFALQ